LTVVQPLPGLRPRTPEGGMSGLGSFVVPTYDGGENIVSLNDPMRPAPPVTRKTSVRPESVGLVG
jgi:hypothetical protein